jgi:hypothetical protein
MAPSRALLRCMTSASARPQTQAYLRPVARLFSTSVVRPQRDTQLSTVLQPSPWGHAYRANLCVRSYSQQASAAPEPPDYLNEAELHIFNKIRGELDPVKLEVGTHVLVTC